MITFIIIALFLVFYAIATYQKKIKKDRSISSYFLIEIKHEIENLKIELENGNSIDNNATRLSNALFRRVIVTIKKGAQRQGNDYISLKFESLIGNLNLKNLHEEEMSKVASFIAEAIRDGEHIDAIVITVIEHYKDYFNPYLLQSV